MTFLLPSKFLTLYFHSPRQGETTDEIQLRGERTLVKKIKLELEKLATTLQDRIVIGVVIPAINHKTLIGRGGQHLTDLQNRTGVQIQFPGSRSYNAAGEVENKTELEGANESDIVKITGSKAACAHASAELKVISLAVIWVHLIDDWPTLRLRYQAKQEGSRVNRNKTHWTPL